MKKASVLISGGSGLIGKYLTQMLVERDYRVALFSRSLTSGHHLNVYNWDIKKGEVEQEAIESADYIIHLTGANIGVNRWFLARKKEIYNSRIDSTKLLYDSLKKLNKGLKGFISASAIGYYGMQSEMECSELCSPGQGFLADVCTKWENQIPQLQSLSGRVLTIRIGVVFGRVGGIFPQLYRQSRMHTGGRLGNGEQWVSWIHIYDLVYGIMYLLNDEKANGIFNLVAPNPVKQKTLAAMMSELGRTGFQLDAPAFIIRLLLGEFGKELLLGGQKVVAGKLIRQGFVFRFPDLRQALNDMFDPYES